MDGVIGVGSRNTASLIDWREEGKGASRRVLKMSRSRKRLFSSNATSFFPGIKGGGGGNDKGRGSGLYSLNIKGKNK